MKRKLQEIILKDVQEVCIVLRNTYMFFVTVFENIIPLFLFPFFCKCHRVMSAPIEIGVNRVLICSHIWNVQKKKNQTKYTKQRFCKH